SGCFSQEAWENMGKISVYNFGLEDRYIDTAKPDFQLIDDTLIDHYFPKIKRTRHKYQAGYVVGWGGSSGMPGAPLMSAFAALRAGAGIVRLLHPSGMEGEFSSAPVELVRQSCDDPETVLAAMERASAVFIGPGMSIVPSALTLLQAVLSQLK